jgi:hypothetical protein
MDFLMAKVQSNVKFLYIHISINPENNCECCFYIFSNISSSKIFKNTFVPACTLYLFACIICMSHIQISRIQFFIEIENPIKTF